MLFDTPVYFFFLAVIVVAYWQLSWRPQNVMLLAASYFFYGWWDWRFLGLILISTVVDYHCAKYIADSEDPWRRRLLLSISLLLNVTFLGFFKYFNFFTDSFVVLLHSLGINYVPTLVLQIILPPGISFYTFQEIAYMVDVYHRKLPATRSLVDYALFISLFPHLIAGPIQRPDHLLPQVQKPRVFDSEKVFSGVMLILTGLFRKCVIADNCGLLANAAFGGKLGDPNLAVLALGTYAFAWQIYGDFSGYSDIARGSAQLMGFHFMVNFRQPYLATSLQDFWRRWHISLSTWLRDYLYIPLGGNRGGEAKTYRNLMTTMLLGGLWHGANWTFVIWGGIHGGGLAVERLLSRWTGADRKPEPSKQAALFSPKAWMWRVFWFHMVCLAWIFFRAQSIQGAFHVLAGLGHPGWRPELLAAFEFLALFSIPLFLLDLVLEYREEEYPLEKTKPYYQLAYAASLLLLVTLFSANDVNAFLYFQF
ncbi:MBOAT family O-acyltransferase [Paludibaculum fermentans]|uniref:MBOAT family protein n=1 Tax=Paludibaculum fermentans TaxID=1473598 RepID=A0A7S7SQ71_PALFE|nr:MBOAT family protein [Paludibaculum fermentans]QOY92301.1 MBOAT family protein [Paludibaculum fermentans]